MLGTFMPTPYVTVRGNGVIGGGYSPLGHVRPRAIARRSTARSPPSGRPPPRSPPSSGATTASPVVAEGTSFSNPNQPALSPVVYPTRASNYSALKFQSTPPQWDKAIMWIDQN